MLKEILNKLELNSDDTPKSAFIKGLAEGALEGLVIVGLAHTLANIFNKNK